MSGKISKEYVLYSPGFGAGWTSWNTSLPREARELMLRHTGLIEALQAGEELTEEHPAVKEFLADMAELYDGYICLAAVDQLSVYPTESRVRIDEYDGSERVVLSGNDEYF